jgi:hypothetical protein
MPETPTGVAHGNIDIQPMGAAAPKPLRDWLTGFVSVAGETLLANYIALQSQLVGTSPAVAAVGTDANLDIRLAPKGTGTVVLTGTVPPLVGPLLPRRLPPAGRAL